MEADEKAGGKDGPNEKLDDEYALQSSLLQLRAKVGSLCGQGVLDSPPRAPMEDSASGLELIHTNRPGMEHIILFDEVLFHVARIARTLAKQGGGSCFSVGWSGSGRRSVATLAGLLCNFAVARREASAGLSDKDFLMELWKLAVLEQQNVMCLISEETIGEKMAGYLNALLASDGCCPDLFSEEDMIAMLTNTAGAGRAFGSRCRAHDLSRTAARKPAVLHLRDSSHGAHYSGQQSAAAAAVQR